MNIGQRIAARRKELGLTQEELATQVFVTTQAVSQWENGKTTLLPANHLRITKERSRHVRNDVFRTLLSTIRSTERGEEIYGD